MPAPSRALVLQLARFGDLVQTRRLIASLLADGRETHLLVDHSLVPLARLVHPECEVHGVAAHALPAPAAVLAEVRRTVEALRALEFQTIYALNFSPLAEALVAAFPEAHCRGYAWRQGQLLRAPWLSLAFRWAGRRAVAPCNLADLWAHLHEDPLAPSLVNPPAAPKGGGLGVVMAGRNARRSLPPSVLAGCVAALVHRLGKSVPIHLLGSTAESAAARALLEALPRNLRGQARDVTGRTDWAALHGLVGGLDCVLTPDTGVMHLAARLGVPVVATFLSSAWAWETGPYGQGHTVWQATLECAPCLESQPCHHRTACLAPFSDRALLRLLSMDKGDPPAGVVRLASTLDELGCDFTATAGQDPHAASRRRWRETVMADRRLAAQISPGAAAVAEHLYQEPDWTVHAQGCTEAC
ncbi:glycosyltransferase family 9 protein [Megalodesulfovibrio gigas]|uniref:Putative glycosyl transferase n=1 Tax=Megalodesulfovibrio gigas (strain ATCC 19364 / DSM 1382 / NCIMB 9332 / VKM B-1759) TaxID=1121448 RepID=T2GDN9_MEGG1|nr:glycosyltransferase family 9 protein [Megalodesulfovibrio gigas]AGW14294.1 putative glycosyl transferase [Megalodesulfovibrio gigas DSM 1382 = ATCC 19364]